MQKRNPNFQAYTIAPAGGLFPEIHRMAELIVNLGDCLEVLPTLPEKSVDIIVTSPPYDRKVIQRNGNGDSPAPDYLTWLSAVLQELKRVLKDNGSLFLNIAGKPSDPTLPLEVFQLAQSLFKVQNRIIWCKSITVDGTSHGQFRPLPGQRYLNNVFEEVFHLTKKGTVKLDRLAIGVPYQDKSNIKRFNQANDCRCGGNVWFIPYKTTKSRADNFNHPCPFPVELPKRCLKLHGVRSDTVVLDPFAGSGTTLIAAAKLNAAKAIGIEIEPAFAEVCLKRFLKEA